MVPALAPESLENILEMQHLCLHLRWTEFEIIEWDPIVCILRSPPDDSVQVSICEALLSAAQPQWTLTRGPIWWSFIFWNDYFGTTIEQRSNFWIRIADRPRQSSQSIWKSHVASGITCKFENSREAQNILLSISILPFLECIRWCLWFQLAW